MQGKKITIYLPEQLFKKMKSFGLPMSKVIQIGMNYYFENKNKEVKNDVRKV
ncbi:MAG: hypothetical protein IMZ52_08945 [Actinobacteria bacterium]|nr:hypothetical protein [Actinomycetota bacterium]MBE3122164.1 hypothetical protein [Thermoplasmata archaeon]